MEMSPRNDVHTRCNGRRREPRRPYRASENVRNNLMRLVLNAGSLSSVCGAQEAADHGDVAAK